MNILLVGEYNRSHKSLKDGLVALGHEAKVVGLTDGFKKATVDIEIKNRFSKGLLKTWRTFIYKLFKKDLYAQDVKKQLLKRKRELSGHDIIQFVNESSFICPPHIEIELFDLLTSWNTKAFLLSCGTDYTSVKYAYDKKFRYSILTPYFENRLSKDSFSLGLKYITPEFEKLHKHIFKAVAGVISCDLDYTIPLEGHPKHLGLIPHVINIDAITYTPLTIDHKIIIFHGINRNNYYKKGNDIFEKAIELIEEQYADRIEVITVENLPYKAYIEAFNSAHILLDQVYAYDQGYNALEAMAKGKIVFTGAEREWLDYYKLDEDSVVINALPDPVAIAKKLEWLLLNPEELLNISKRARAFVEDKHHYITNAKQYLDLWQKA
ncbi:glycosyltransferase [Psychroserpens sp. MEBiC05023]